MLGLIVALAATIFIVAHLREAILDWLTLFSPGGKLAVVGLCVGFFVFPIASRGGDGAVEGFACILIPMTVIAVSDASIRALLAVMLIGFWAAFGALDPGGASVGVAVALGCGATTLWTFAAAHFALMATPFGLRGWWPARRVAATVAIYFVPSALAAWLIHRHWPGGSALVGAPEIDVDAIVGPGLPPMPAIRPLRALTSEEFGRLVIQSVISAFVLLVSVVLLHYLRRLLSRKFKPARLPKLLGADVSQVDLHESELLPRRVALKGIRAKIVAQWARWAREASAAGVQRAPGETAAELAARAAEAEGIGEPPAEMTELFERAHYGADEPTAEDLDRMRRLVRGGIERGD
jgi:hypothetical protein